MLKEIQQKLCWVSREIFIKYDIMKLCKHDKGIHYDSIHLVVTSFIFLYHYSVFCIFLWASVLLSAPLISPSVIPFRQPAGDIPPSHAPLGEAHLCNLYWEDAGGELYCLYLPTVRVRQWGVFSYLVKGPNNGYPPLSLPYPQQIN